jgi:hypothetical protein
MADFILLIFWILVEIGALALAAYICTKVAMSVINQDKSKNNTAYYTNLLYNKDQEIQNLQYEIGQKEVQIQNLMTMLQEERSKS